MTYVPLFPSMPKLLQNVVGEPPDMLFGRHIDTAMLKGFRGHTFLRHLADLPILPVDEISNSNGIHWIEIILSHHLGIEQPIAGHASQFWSQRLKEIDHHMVAQHINEDIGHQQDAVVAAYVLGQETRKWWTAGFSCNSESLDALR